MEEEKPKRGLFEKILLIIKAILGVALIWLGCTIVAIIVSMLVMKVCTGECTIDLFEKYGTYIKTGYTIFLSICISLYLRHFNQKYKLM